MDVKTCLFCNSTGPYQRSEHVIPEALGNDDLVLHGEVCDECNQYFGSKVESFVLAKTPFAFWRTFLGVRKKKGKLPHVNLSQPNRQKGRLPAIHPMQDNGVGFTYHEDFSVSVDIDDDEIIREIISGQRNQFAFSFTPAVLSMMGRFLCKVGVELLCLDNPMRARSDSFMRTRTFSRYGSGDWLWPIFHGESGTITDLKQRTTDAEGLLEQVFCYEYRLLDVGTEYTLLVLTIGTDTWMVSLNDPYPTPAIREALPDIPLKLLWYAPEELRREGIQQLDGEERS